MRHTCLLLLLVSFAACGDDGGQPGIDAPKTIDARIDARIVDADIDAPFFPDAFIPPTVTTVTCPVGTIIPEVTASAGTFNPTSVTIAVDGIVKFTMPSNHSVVPHVTLPTDSGLVAPFNAITCLKFSAAGTFKYQCNPHAFVGTVVVQ